MKRKTRQCGWLWTKQRKKRKWQRRLFFGFISCCCCVFDTCTFANFARLIERWSKTHMSYVNDHILCFNRLLLRCPCLDEATSVEKLFGLWNKNMQFTFWLGLFRRREIDFLCFCLRFRVFSFSFQLFNSKTFLHVRLSKTLFLGRFVRERKETAELFNKSHLQTNKLRSLTKLSNCYLHPKYLINQTHITSN